MPGIFEVFDTMFNGAWVLFVLALIIFIFAWIIGGYFGPLFKNDFLKNAKPMTWISDFPDKGWFAYKIVAGMVLVGFFGWLIFKFWYEKEEYAEAGGY